MPAWVLLRHELPDGSWHYDWMLESGPPGTPLTTFRVSARPDAPETRAFRAERLPDHRPAYLNHQGPVSNGRGSVTRLARGEFHPLHSTPDRLEVRLLTPHPRHWCGTPECPNASHWTFNLLEPGF